MITKVHYYSPTISITAGELYNIISTRTTLHELAQEGLHCYDDAVHIAFRGNYSYPKGNIIFKISGQDERSPLIVTGTNQREMQRVASKLSRILKIGPFDLVDKGEFA